MIECEGEEKCTHEWHMDPLETVLTVVAIFFSVKYWIKYTWDCKEWYGSLTLLFIPGFPILWTAAMYGLHTMRKKWQIAHRLGGLARRITGKNRDQPRVRPL